MTLQLSHPDNITAQKVNLNVCKFLKNIFMMSANPERNTDGDKII